MVHPDLPCLILAGGQSRRFGAVKGHAPLAGRSLVCHVHDRLSAQTKGAIALNTPLSEAYGSVGLLCVPDVLSGGLGPLAGIHAGLAWAEGMGASLLLTAPIDTPFLPDDLVQRLCAAGAPAIAMSGGRDHPVCGLWPVSLKAHLAERMEAGLRAARDWASETGAERVAFKQGDGPPPFFNINTREDLAEAEAYCRSEHG